MSKDLFDVISVEKSTMYDFWAPAEGEHTVVVVDMPTELKDSEIPGTGVVKKLFLKIIDSNALLKTWSITVPDNMKVTEASMLGQLKNIKVANSIDAWKGTTLSVLKTGSGKASRYRIKFLKYLNSAEFKKIMDASLAKTEELANAKTQKAGSDLDELFK